MNRYHLQHVVVGIDLVRHADAATIKFVRSFLKIGWLEPQRTKKFDRLGQSVHGLEVWNVPVRLFFKAIKRPLLPVKYVPFDDWLKRTSILVRISLHSVSSSPPWLSWSSRHFVSSIACIPSMMNDHRWSKSSSRRSAFTEVDTLVNVDHILPVSGFVVSSTNDS